MVKNYVLYDCDASDVELISHNVVPLRRQKKKKNKNNYMGKDNYSEGQSTPPKLQSRC